MTTNRTPCVTQELLPCPFCGSETKKIVSPLGFGNIRAAECSNTLCAVTGPWGRNEAEAITAWNTRQSAEAASRDLVAEMSDTIRTLQNELQAHKDALAQWGGGHDPE